MRQFFKYGSVRGAARKGGPYRDLESYSVSGAHGARMFHSRGSLRDPTLDRGAIHDYGVRAKPELSQCKTIARPGLAWQSRIRVGANRK